MFIDNMTYWPYTQFYLFMIVQPSETLNPLTAKLFNSNFHLLEVVSRWREPQLQVSEKITDLLVDVTFYL